MRLGHIHVEFWESKQRYPEWAKQVPGRHPGNKQSKYRTTRSLIDECVNWNGGDKLYTHATTSLILLLKSVRRRGGDLGQYLDQMVSDPGTLIEPDRRRAYARRWATRLRKGV